MTADNTQSLLSALIRAETVTPAAAPALEVLETVLSSAGFDVHRPVFSHANTPDVENLFATIGSGSRHLTLAGHVDVVPTGDAGAWRHPPFAAAIEEGHLYGRGAVDMKGGLAAMVIAAVDFLAARGADFDGRISFLVTGDEEGPAINGTAKLLEWAVARGERFSAALVGEPTSATTLGDQIKVGRRGSYSATLTVHGRQGHAAYPEKADNPVRGLLPLLQALLVPLDEGSDRFQPSTLEIVSLDIGNPAWNVIPAEVAARFNSRFNDHWTAQTLEAEIRARLARAAGETALRPGARDPVKWTLHAEPTVSNVFLTDDPEWIECVSGAVRTVSGKTPALATGGGTSDARFIKDYCPVVEFGPVGTTMHQIDECIPLDELDDTKRIYEAVLEAYFRS